MPNYTLEKVYLGDSYKVISANVYKDSKKVFNIENSCNLKSDIFVKEINQLFENEMTNYRVEQYLKLKAEIKASQDLADLMLKQIIECCGENESTIGNHKLTRVTRKQIGYAKAVKDLLPDADLSAYETTTSYWTLK